MSAYLLAAAISIVGFVLGLVAFLFYGALTVENGDTAKSTSLLILAIAIWLGTLVWASHVVYNQFWGVA